MEITDRDPFLPPSLATKYSGRLIYYLVRRIHTIY